MDKSRSILRENSRKLILFTSDFPFGSGETFLENEVPYLSRAFEQVVLVPTEQVNGDPRAIPENMAIEVPNFPFERLGKVSMLKQLFHPDFLHELFRIVFVYRLLPTPKRVKTALVSLFRGKQITLWLQQIGVEPSRTVLYSYWCNDAAIGISLFKRKNPSVRDGWDLYFEASTIGYLPYRSLITTQFDMVCPVSEAGVKYIFEKWKCNRTTNIQLARLGVEAQTPPNALPDVFTVVSCSNLIPLKRVHLIIEALSKINDIPLKWVHFGDGPLSTELYDLAERILPPNISWKFMGHIPNQELLQWYRENPVSVFINVSETEGIPVSIMEAMSFGIPVIATNVGGTGEIVREVFDGMLVSAEGSHTEVSEVLIRLSKLSSNELIKVTMTLKNSWTENCNAKMNYISFTDMLLNLGNFTPVNL